MLKFGAANALNSLTTFLGGDDGAAGGDEDKLVGRAGMAGYVPRELDE